MPKPQSHFAVFGLAWGDEGKGKVVDLLCSTADVVVRFNGGANAGHTVWVGDEKYALHLLPTGILHRHCEAVIGPGVVVDPISLLSELDALSERGIHIDQRLHISDRAHLVMPYHKIEDRLSERASADHQRIGTTAQGIGPCYADKMRRSWAIRVADLLDEPDMLTRARQITEQKRTYLRALYGDDGGLSIDEVIDGLRRARSRLASMVTDTTHFLLAAINAGRSILFEAANGLLLDVDHGTYPYVTSSGTGPHAIGAGAGIAVSRIDRIIGTTKAYATRVGGGPFVTELRDAIGNKIRQVGNEYGTTTGRPRRCGWFDAVACRHSVDIGCPTDIAMMHLDTLGGFDPIGVCTAYRVDGKLLHTLPADARLLARCEPEFEFLPGWTENIRTVRRFEDLPANARSYVHRIEALLGAPVTLIGVGPDRAETISRGPLAATFYAGPA